MDLLSIIGIVWRHKLLAIPVVLLTLAGAFYVIAIKAPVYQASSSLLLLSPPGPPSAAQIAANRKLAKIDPNNPYVNFGDLPVVADAVIESVTSNTVEQTLVDEGVNPEYQVVLSTDFGNPPIIQITGIGSTAAAAMRAASLVTSTSVNDLYQIQKAQGVNQIYMITATELVKPTTAQTSASGKLRTLIAVLGIGALLLFTVISLAEAVKRRRSPGRLPVSTPALAAGPAPADLPREASKSREPGESRDPREWREPRAPRYSRESRESREPREVRQSERPRDDRRGADLPPRNGVGAEEHYSERL
ncbi:MAG TPA: Wzz/FepE/Etk N-terminal domain-containing protein [Streptosporangiaceae bacterium]|nr:Wzz/FepE/Etk N-terminal domain-containing protein [Streptosporangiaceae bacterium]